MKKVIIALLVVASLFAFVSCKDDVKYDDWAKMKFLDRTEGEGEIFDVAVHKFFSEPGSFSCTGKATFKIDNSFEDVKGTLVSTYSYDENEDTGVYEFTGSVDGESVKNFKFTTDISDDVCDANGDEFTDPNDIALAEKINGQLLIVNNKVEAEFSDTYEKEYETGEEVQVGETSTKISAIKVTVSGTGYSLKSLSIPVGLGSCPAIANSATDYTFEITCNNNKTLKATLSAFVSDGPSEFMTVTIGGKTYLYSDQPN